MVPCAIHETPDAKGASKIQYIPPQHVRAALLAALVHFRISFIYTTLRK